MGQGREQGRGERHGEALEQGGGVKHGTGEGNPRGAETPTLCSTPHPATQNPVRHSIHSAAPLLNPTSNHGSSEPHQQP